MCRNSKYGIGISPEIDVKSPIVLMGDLYRAFETAKRHDYSGVEVHTSNYRTIPLQKILGLCMEFDMKIISFSTGGNFVNNGLSLTSTDALVRNEAVQCIYSYINAAKMLNAKVIIGTIRGNIGARTKTAYDNILKESLEKCIKRAERENVTLVFEAINRYEIDNYNNAAQCIELIKELDSKCFKLHLDTFHMNIEESSLYDAILNSKEYLAHFHIADSNRMYPGAGHIDFSSVFSALCETGYSGYIVTEHFPTPNSEFASKKAIDNMKEFNKMNKGY